MKRIVYRFLLITINLFIAITILGQEYLKISGRVIDNSDSKAVVFANVSIKNTYLGVITNEIGAFELKLPSDLLYDTLEVSSLGYKSYRIPLKGCFNKNDVIIKLHPEIFDIEEVIVTPEAKNPELIVQKALKAIKKNYPKKTFYLDVFFREMDYSGNTYLRLMEAAIGIQDFGFDSNIERIRIKLLELRKSYDYLEYSFGWKFLNMFLGEQNILYKTYYYNSLRNYKNILLFDKKNNRLYNFSLDDIVFQDSSLIYVINYTPNGFCETRDRPLLDKEGKLYINQSDYAIVKATANYFVNRPGTAGKLLFDSKYTTKSIVTYRKIKGKYYLSYLKYFSGFSGSPLYKDDNSKYRSQYTQSSFYVTNIYTSYRDFDKVKRREKEKNDIDLYKKEFPYNADFWKTYNSILMNPLFKKVKLDLEKDKTLETQYKENNNK